MSLYICCSDDIFTYFSRFVQVVVVYFIILMSIFYSHALFAPNDTLSSYIIQHRDLRKSTFRAITDNKLFDLVDDVVARLNEDDQS